MSTEEDLDTKAGFLKITLIARATGGQADNDRYESLRSELLLSDPRIKDKLPRFLTYCRNLNEFWSFIQPKFSTYQERREYLHQAFEPVFETLATTQATREKAYDKGQAYDFYRDIREIICQATDEVFLTDTYPTEEILDLYLEKVPPGIKIRILVNKPQSNFLRVAKKFKMKPGVDFEVRSSKDCHDRLCFIGHECWIRGQSLKDAGKKPTYLVKIESTDLFRDVFEKLWSQAQILV